MPEIELLVSDIPQDSVALFSLVVDGGNLLITFWAL